LVVRRQHPKRDVLVQPFLQPPRREHPNAVAVDQNLGHHPRMVRRVSSLLLFVIRLDRTQEVVGIIVLQEGVGYTDRIFIIPTRDVLDAYGSHERGFLSLFIPTESRPSYQNSQPRLAWGKYEGAWPQAHCKTSQQSGADNLAKGR
jgi:hypothetical protein